MALSLKQHKPAPAANSEREVGVSIIIPCHNCAATLAETIASILANQPKTVAFEIIMVNDAPGDTGTAKACEAALRECEKAGVAASLHSHDKNLGVSAARNTALAAAKYRYTFPIDADDMLPIGSRFIDKAVRILERDPGTAFVYPSLKFTGTKTHRPFVRPYDEKSVLVQNTIPCCTMYRTDEALAVGGYAEQIKYGEDQELGLAILAARYQADPAAPRRVRRLLSETYLYRQHSHGNNATSQFGSGATWPIHMARLITRAGPLYDYHYGTRDHGAVRKKFMLNAGNLALAATRRLQACLSGERPLVDLIRIPGFYRP